MHRMIATAVVVSASAALFPAAPATAAASAPKAAPKAAPSVVAAPEVTSAACKKPCNRKIVNDYPYKTSSWHKADPWNFFRRECVSFAAWRVRKRLGLNFHNHYRGVKWGNANNWDNAARRARVKVNRSPKVGAIAQWNSGRFGHVAYVARVNGSTILVEEYNKGGTHSYTTRTIKRSSVHNYIHF
ncbi:CHAP domain-containing protein [Actinomadura kijaniata]|uniref:CHAP domain-containing protein n=1 Tax=Actinomadura kijaniata TaxID=46161 RepID=UPI000830D891|nr:CHAP domain-containing protein [Actinomadura kijaniata]